MKALIFLLSLNASMASIPSSFEYYRGNFSELNKTCDNETLFEISLNALEYHYDQKKSYAELKKRGASYLSLKDNMMEWPLGIGNPYFFIESKAQQWPISFSSGSIKLEFQNFADYAEKMHFLIMETLRNIFSKKNLIDPQLFYETVFSVFLKNINDTDDHFKKNNKNFINDIKIIFNFNNVEENFEKINKEYEFPNYFMAWTEEEFFKDFQFIFSNVIKKYQPGCAKTKTQKGFFEELQNIAEQHHTNVYLTGDTLVSLLSFFYRIIHKVVYKHNEIGNLKELVIKSIENEENFASLDIFGINEIFHLECPTENEEVFNKLEKFILSEQKKDATLVFQSVLVSPYFSKQYSGSKINHLHLSLKDGTLIDHDGVVYDFLTKGTVECGDILGFSDIQSAFKTLYKLPFVEMHFEKPESFDRIEMLFDNSEASQQKILPPPDKAPDSSHKPKTFLKTVKDLPQEFKNLSQNTKNYYSQLKNLIEKSENPFLFIKEFLEEAENKLHNDKNKKKLMKKLNNIFYPEDIHLTLHILHCIEKLSKNTQIHTSYKNDFSEHPFSYRNAIQKDIALNSRFGQVGNNCWIEKNGFFYAILKNSGFLLNKYPFYYYEIQEKHCDEFKSFYKNYTDNGMLYHGTSRDAALSICFFNNILCSNNKNQTIASYGDGFYTTSSHNLASSYAHKHKENGTVIRMNIHPCLVKKQEFNFFKKIDGNGKEYTFIKKINNDKENNDMAIAIFYFTAKNGSPIALIRDPSVIDFSSQKLLFLSEGVEGHNSSFNGPK